MSVNVIDIIKAKNSGSFPVVEDVDQLGGYRAVPDLTARDSIPAQRRKVGMRVRVVATTQTFELAGGIDNANWTLVSEGGLVAHDVKVSGTDTTPGLLGHKLVQGSNVTLTTINPAGDEQIRIDATGGFYADRTTGTITMHVNPSTGMTPPAGTIVHNQAEYDALGAPLRYAQDAVEVLPIGIGHPVIVVLDDGIHLAKPASRGYGSGATTIWTKRFFATNEKYGQTVSGTPYTIANQIYFKGANRTVLYSGSGTAAARGAISGITPGGMTINQYLGKLLIFTSGANAGTIMPIRTNGVDSLNGPPMSTGAGACTFDIYEPAATILDSLNGSTQAFALMRIYGESVQLFFDNIKIGNDTVPFTQITVAPGVSGRCTFLYSMFNCNFQTVLACSAAGSQFSLFNSVFKLSGSEIAILHDVQASIYNNLFYGSFNAVYGLFDIEGGSAYLGNNMIQVTDAYTGPIFGCIGAKVSFTAENWMWNQSITPAPGFTAFNVNDMSSGSYWPDYDATQINGYYMYVDGANKLLYVRNSAALTVTYAYSFFHIGANNNVLWDGAYSNVKTSAFINGDLARGLVTDITLDGLNYNADILAVAPNTWASGTELIGQYGSHLILSAR